MKVEAYRERDGWYFGGKGVKGGPFASYPETVRGAKDGGHEIDNLGWKHALRTGNWTSHSIEGYPGWEIDVDGAPAYVRLSHVRGEGEVESRKLAIAWDDLAEVDFYYRDWTENGIPFVTKGKTYWSGWYFATYAERDRFMKWHAGKPLK